MLTKEERYQKYREIIKNWWERKINQFDTEKWLLPEDKLKTESEALKFIDKEKSFQERKEFFQRMLNDEAELARRLEETYKANKSNPPFVGEWLYGNGTY